MYSLFELKEVIRLKDKYKEIYNVEVLNFKLLNNNDMNIDVVGISIIEVPEKEYFKDLVIINLFEDLTELQKQKQIIEDNTLNIVNAFKELTNQSQRESKLRQLLLDNQVYLELEKCILNIQKLKMLIISQNNRYDQAHSSYKLRYRNMCNLLFMDKKMNEGLE